MTTLGEGEHRRYAGIFLLRPGVPAALIDSIGYSRTVGVGLIWADDPVK